MLLSLSEKKLLRNLSLRECEVEKFKLILRQQPGTAQKIIILNYLTNNEKKTFF
jgi:hypothetical protein